MARSFRTSRFRGAREIGEDVNPSAYIVNLADCMLVLACGFLVALISFWQIDISPLTEQFEEEQLEEIDPETLPEDILEGGSYYIEAGTAYRDPNTGILYIVKPSEDFETSGQSAAAESASSASADQAAPESSDAGMSENDIREARAAGGD